MGNLTRAGMNPTSIDIAPSEIFFDLRRESSKPGLDHAPRLAESPVPLKAQKEVGDDSARV